MSLTDWWYFHQLKTGNILLYLTTSARHQDTLILDFTEACVWSLLGEIIASPNCIWMHPHPEMLESHSYEYVSLLPSKKILKNSCGSADETQTQLLQISEESVSMPTVNPLLKANSLLFWWGTLRSMKRWTSTRQTYTRGSTFSPVTTFIQYSSVTLQCNTRSLFKMSLSLRWRWWRSHCRNSPGLSVRFSCVHVESGCYFAPVATVSWIFGWRRKEWMLLMGIISRFN